MAESVFPRIPITRPHTEINVDTSGIGGSASSSEKILCLIGQAEGGEPNTVYELRNYSSARTKIVQDRSRRSHRLCTISPDR